MLINSASFWGLCIWLTHSNINNANSPTSGRCPPHFKIFTPVKTVAFSPAFLPYQTYQWVINSECFLYKSNWNLGNCLPKHGSHTYPIDKNMPLTFWLMWLSLFLFLWLFFPLKFHWRYWKVLSVIWQMFNELSAKHEKQAWNICQFCTRLLLHNTSLSIAHKNIMQGMWCK